MTRPPCALLLLLVAVPLASFGPRTVPIGSLVLASHSAAVLDASKPPSPSWNAREKSLPVVEELCLFSIPSVLSCSWGVETLVGDVESLPIGAVPNARGNAPGYTARFHHHLSPDGSAGYPGSWSTVVQLWQS